MFSRFSHFITLRPYLIAMAISVFLLGWMLVPKSNAVNGSLSQGNAASEKLPKVETTHYVAKKVTKKLTLYGKSEANSRAVIRAEVPGKIISASVDKGGYVQQNDTLVNIEKSELPARLKQAKANLTERELTYKAVKSLNDKGLQGRVRLAEVNSQLLAAKTEMKSLQLSLKRTNVVAPFNGILQEQFAEVGDYMQVGDPIFSLENTDPMVIRGDVTEHYIHHFARGQAVSATLISGQVITGKVSYIASLADRDSSTFRVEAEFPNPALNIFSGISAKLTIPLYQVNAIYVSPSVLALNEEGDLGVKVVQEGHVAFKPIKLVEADNDGAWLSGFDSGVDIITLGQGFVKDGDKVDVVKRGQIEPAKNDNDENSQATNKTTDVVRLNNSAEL